MRRRVLLALSLACLTAQRLPAQVSLSVGGVRASYAGGPATDALQGGLRVDLAGGNSRTSAGLNYASFQGGGWAAQLLADATSAHNFGRAGALASVAVISGNYLDDGRWGGQLRLGLVFARRLGPTVTSIGASGGGLRAIDSAGSGLVALHASSEMRLGPASISLRAQHTSLRQTSYDDAELGASGSIGLVRLLGGVGLRGYRSRPAEGTWHAQTIVQVQPWLALEASGGRSPTSPEGFEKGAYVNAGMRLIAVGRASAPPMVERVGTGQVRVHFALGDAREAAIAGDWNDWSPVPLNKDSGGRWSALLSLSGGAHKFVLVVDGRNVVPRGVPKLPDGFGGEVGLLVP